MKLASFDEKRGALRWRQARRVNRGVVRTTRRVARSFQFFVDDRHWFGTRDARIAWSVAPSSSRIAHQIEIKYEI